MNATPESAPLDLEVTRQLSGAREQVWNLWTDPPGLVRWWWPERFHTIYRTDLSVGGSFRYTTDDVPPMGVLELAGTYLEIDPPTHLRYTWRWESDLGHESLVTVSFRETAPDKTEVRVRQVGLRDTDDRNNHVVGWNDCLDRLEAMLSA